MGGKTSNASKTKYNAKAYDRLAINVKKGERDKIQAYAVKKGMSINSYVTDLIRRDMGIFDKED